jgi:hypothetical protein
MKTLVQDSALAKPEVQQAVKKAASLLRDALPEASFEQRERIALAMGNEAVRQMLQADLEEMVMELDADMLEVDGRPYVRHQPGTVTYHSLCGPLAIDRHTYRDAQVRNGPTVVPLELAAGLVERATPALAFALIRDYAISDSRETEEQLRAAARIPPSRSTIERVDRAVGQVACDEVTTIERAVRRTEALPEGTCGITMGLDRTSAPMVERPEGEPQPSPRRKKPLLRRSSGRYDVVFRMAYVGTVAFVDEYGETIEARRYAAPACDDPRELVPRMTADIAAALKRNPELPVGIIQDGAHEMWNRTREGLVSLQEQGVLEDWYEGIDRYHLMERLGEALALVEPDPNERDVLLCSWGKQFDEYDNTIDFVQDYLQRKYSELTPAKAEQLWEHLVYLKNNKDRMRYATLRAVGLPCGSGVTESAAKTVIGQRAKRGGQRWCEEGLRAALTLRAVVLSNRYDKFWRHLSRRYTARITLAA